MSLLEPRISQGGLFEDWKMLSPTSATSYAVPQGDGC